jgi:hypothetical protein
MMSDVRQYTNFLIEDSSISVSWIKKVMGHIDSDEIAEYRLRIRDAKSASDRRKIVKDIDFSLEMCQQGIDVIDGKRMAFEGMSAGQILAMVVLPGGILLGASELSKIAARKSLGREVLATHLKKLQNLKSSMA